MENPTKKSDGRANLKTGADKFYVRKLSKINAEAAAKAIPGKWWENRRIIHAYLLYIRSQLVQGNDVMLYELGNLRLKYGNRKCGPRWGVRFKASTGLMQDLKHLVGVKTVERKHISWSGANKHKFKDSLASRPAEAPEAGDPECVPGN